MSGSPLNLRLVFVLIYISPHERSELSRTKSQEIVTNQYKLSYENLTSLIPYCKFLNLLKRNLQELTKVMPFDTQKNVLIFLLGVG